MSDFQFASNERFEEVSKKYKDAYLAKQLGFNEFGHSFAEDPWRDGQVCELLEPHIFRWFFNEEALSKVERALETPIEGDFDAETWIQFYTSGTSCKKCGRRLTLFTNGKELRLIETRYFRERKLSENHEYHNNPCIYAATLPTPTVEIDVSSGQLCMGNDLRDIFTDELCWSGENAEKEYSDECDISHLVGTMGYMKHYASFGLATAFMGCGGSDVFISPTSIILGDSLLIDPENDEDTREKTMTVDGIVHHLAAHISFGLWWYGAADLDRIKELTPDKAKKIKPTRKFKDYPKSYDGHELFRVPVKPGRWRLTHHCNSSGDRYSTENKIVVASRLQFMEES